MSLGRERSRGYMTLEYRSWSLTRLNEQKLAIRFESGLQPLQFGEESLMDWEPDCKSGASNASEFDPHPLHRLI